MKRNFAVLAFVLSLPAGLLAQYVIGSIPPLTPPSDSFGIKRDNIGEPMQDFRARNQGIYTEEPFSHGGNPESFTYPRCSFDIGVPPRPKVPQAPRLTMAEHVTRRRPGLPSTPITRLR
jgi:hypothetical protein